MRRTIRDAIVVNWPIKVTALALATVLWAAVSAEEPATQLVPIRLDVQPPPNRTLVQRPPTIQALVAGSPDELIKLYASEPFILRTIPDTTVESFVTLTMVPEDVTLGSNANVSIQDLVPRQVTVVLDDVAERAVRVVPRVDVTAASGFLLMGSPSAVPDSVTVIGPEAQVQRIGSVFTLPLQIEDVRESQRVRVAIDTAAFGAVRLSPVEVEIAIRIDALTARTLDSVPVIIAGGLWEGEPAIVQVTLRGPASRLQRMTRDSVRVTAAAPSAEGEALPVRVQGPAGLVATAVPDSVRAGRMVQ